MTVIDAQVHIWGAETLERPWPPGGAALAPRPTPLGKDELLREMDAAGVDRAVLVPPSWEGERNDLALEAALLHPDRFAVMGRLAIERPESRSLVDTSLHAPIRRVVEAYGPHRVFWGTDLTRLRGSYRQAVTLFTEELDFLSDIDKTWIMGRGIAEWLGWPL